MSMLHQQQHPKILHSASVVLPSTDHTGTVLPSTDHTERRLVIGVGHVFRRSYGVGALRLIFYHLVATRLRPPHYKEKNSWQVPDRSHLFDLRARGLFES